jgi:hypothetical protein
MIILKGKRNKIIRNLDGNANVKIKDVLRREKGWKFNYIEKELKCMNLNKKRKNGGKLGNN